MIKFRMTLTPELLVGMLELCNLRGVDYISFVVADNKIYCGAIGQEYLKALDTGAVAEVENISIRISASVLRTIMTQGILQLEIDDCLVITKLVYTEIVASIKVPIELDFSGDLLCRIVEASKNEQLKYADFAPFVQLKEIMGISKMGMQVKDHMAFIDGSGYAVYKSVDVDQSFIASQECIQLLGAFVNADTRIKMFQLDQFDIVQRGPMFFGWKRTRKYVPCTWDTFQSLTPLFSQSVDLSEARAVIKAIAISKTKNYECLINFETKSIQVLAGNTGVFRIKYRGIFQLECSNQKELTVKLPFAVFKSILAVNGLDWESFQITVYPSLVELKFGKTSILVVRS